MSKVWSKSDEKEYVELYIKNEEYIIKARDLIKNNMNIIIFC